MSGAAQAASLHFSARLLPARAKQLSAARRATRRSRSAAPPCADSAGVSCRLAAALAPSDERGGSSRLASLLHSAAAGVGDGVTPWAVS